MQFILSIVAIVYSGLVKQVDIKLKILIIQFLQLNLF